MGRSRRQSIIGKFLKANPQFCAVDWNVEFQDLTVWFSDNPSEPFCVTEFVKDTPTRVLLEKLIDDLES